MWERNRDKETGLHSFTVWNASGDVIGKGEGFACHVKCERAAQDVERGQWTNKITEYNTDDLANMTDDELLAELLG